MIKHLLNLVLVIASSAAVAGADAREDVVAAAKKLADSGNYSWTTTTQGGGGGGGGGGSEGMSQQDGLTALDLTFRDVKAKVFFKGDKGAFTLPDQGWKSLVGVGDEPGPALMIANTVKNYRPPADQAINLAEKSPDLKMADDGSFSGALTADEAKALVQRRVVRRRADADGAPATREVKHAKGTVQFWTENGMLTKFEFNVQASVTVNGQERAVNRTTTVQFKDVGSTKIEIPDEAKAKME